MKNNEFKSNIRKKSGLDMDDNAEPHTYTSAAHFILSITGRIVSLNTYGLELLDNIQSNVVGRKFNSFIAEKHQSTFNTFFQKLILNNDALTCELALQTNNSTTKHIIINGVPINSNEISLTITDRTKRISEETAVRKSEELLKKITENAPDIIVKLNRAGTILYINRVPLGFKKGKVIGTNFKDWNSIDDHPKLTDALNRVFEDGVTMTFKTSVYDTNNKIHRFRSSLSPLIEDDGAKKAILIARDITEIEEAEEKLRLSEECYKSLFNNNLSVMLLIDPSTSKIKDANIAACRYYGWSHTELCTKNISDINTLSKTEISAAIKKANNEKLTHFYFKHRLASGEIRDVEIYSVPTETIPI